MPVAAFLRNLTFMTAEPERMADFWSQALGLTERRDESDEILLASEGWPFPRLTFQRVSVGSKGAGGRLHLDITASADRVSEVARLEELGAAQVRTEQVDGFSWTVMTDPDGNEFCVTDP